MPEALSSSSPAAEGRWHDRYDEPSSMGDSDPGGKAQGPLRPAGGHPENLPRTRRDHAGATRQELARPDREDGLRRRIMAFAGVFLGQILYFCAPFRANTAIP